MSAGEQRSAPRLRKKLRRSGVGVSENRREIGREGITLSPYSLFFALVHSFIPFACSIGNAGYTG